MTDQIKNVPLTIIEEEPNFEQIDNDHNEQQDNEQKKAADQLNNDSPVLYDREIETLASKLLHEQLDKIRPKLRKQITKSNSNSLFSWLPQIPFLKKQAKGRCSNWSNPTIFYHADYIQEYIKQSPDDLIYLMIGDIATCVREILDPAKNADH